MCNYLQGSSMSAPWRTFISLSTPSRVWEIDTITVQNVRVPYCTILNTLVTNSKNNVIHVQLCTLDNIINEYINPWEGIYIVNIFFLFSIQLSLVIVGSKKAPCKENFWYINKGWSPLPFPVVSGILHFPHLSIPRPLICWTSQCLILQVPSLPFELFLDTSLTVCKTWIFDNKNLLAMIIIIYHQTDMVYYY